MNIMIRNETEQDFREVEEVTREAFRNLYAPGCTEHYLVHQMRNHPDFIKELDFVAEDNGKDLKISDMHGEYPVNGSEVHSVLTSLFNTRSKRNPKEGKNV